MAEREDRAATTAGTAAHVHLLPVSLPRPQGPVLPCPYALPRRHTWGPGGLGGGFQDTDQGLEEDSKGLGAQRLWAEDRGHGECCPDPQASWHPPDGPGKPGAGHLDAPEERLPCRHRDRPPDHWRGSLRAPLGSTSPDPRGSAGRPGHTHPCGQRLPRATEKSQLQSVPSVPSLGGRDGPSYVLEGDPAHVLGPGWGGRPGKHRALPPGLLPSPPPAPARALSLNTQRPRSPEPGSSSGQWVLRPRPPLAWARLVLIRPEPWHAVLVLPASPSCTHAARPGAGPSPSRSLSSSPARQAPDRPRPRGGHMVQVQGPRAEAATARAAG